MRDVGAMEALSTIIQFYSVLSWWRIKLSENVAHARSLLITLFCPLGISGKVIATTFVHDSK